MPSQIASTSAQPRINNAIVVEAKREQGDGTFATLLDAANPLQHVPGISHAYQALTKDKISPGASLAGKVAIGGAVAGPIGMAVGAGVFVVERVIPGVFKAIGRLFGAGGGEGATGQAKAPAIRLPEGSVSGTLGAQRANTRAANAQNETPLLAQTQQTSRAQAALPQAKGGAWPQLSPSQFDSLLQSFQPGLASVGANDAADNKEQRRQSKTENNAQNNPAAPADLAAQMQANLDKYRAFKQVQ
jgi:hypothetical protein